MTATLNRFFAWLQVRYADARAEANRGEIVEKVIIVTAAAAITDRGDGRHGEAVDLKVGGLHL